VRSAGLDTQRARVLHGATVSWERLQVERHEPVLHVWLNRPEKLNALDTRTLEEIEALFGQLQTDFAIRVVILGGRGRSFCAGADRVNPPGAGSRDAGDRERSYAMQLGARACGAIERVEAITLARIQGHAVGGGALLAASCDFRIASDDATFHIPEVDLGIPLAWGGTPRLIHEIGAARARQMVALCDRVDAATAERWGLVHRVVAADALDDTLNEWADRLVAKPEAALHRTKVQFRAYADRARMGNVSETDGDVLMSALRAGPGSKNFPGS
jgi:enoyl-CoA hydratase/carnithine racemase